MILFLLICYLLTVGIGLWLRRLNLSHLRRHGHELPEGFEGSVERETLGKAVSYTIDQSRVNLVETALDSLLLVVFLFGDLLPLYDRWTTSLTSSFLLQGLLFFLALFLSQSVIDIPFSLYRTFRLEARYGFNTMTLRLWISDFFKSLAISLVLLSLLLGGALLLMEWSPRYWWLWVWLFFALFTLFMMYLSPILIEPLFFKVEPIADPELESEIRDLAHRAGLEAKKVQQVDASRRSTHSNAYFTGIGKVKRIVLFDTLLEQMSRGEVLAVLAHEIGHWKKGHIFKRIFLTEAVALVVCYLSFRLLEWGGLPGLIGLSSASFPAQLMILSFLGSLVTFPLTPLSSAISRRHEREADRFGAALCGNAEDLATSLIKLTKENLGNLHPHPLYARFYYSHPPTVERVRLLREGK